MNKIIKMLKNTSIDGTKIFDEMEDTVTTRMCLKRIS